MTTELSDYYLERLGSHNTAVLSIPLRIGANSIGRLPTNNIVLASKYASRKHCTIYVTDTEQLTAKNDASTNGIFINGAQRINRDIEICLSLNDIVGIGCDTSKDEIGDTECYIFKVKRNTVEVKADEIISLDDSEEEEEECKIQEEYSQMNLSEMKQEYMELEDFVEELSSFNNEPEVEYVPIENPVCVGSTRSIESAVGGHYDEMPSNQIKQTKEEAKKPKNRAEKESKDRRNERHAVRKKESKAKKEIKDETNVEITSHPQINRLHVTIPLECVLRSSDRIRESSSAEKKVSSSKKLTRNDCRSDSKRRVEASHSRNRKSSHPSPTSPVQNVCQNESTKSAEASTYSRTRERRNTIVPSSASARRAEATHSRSRKSSVPPSTSPVRSDSTKPVEVARILKRRNTFVPLSTSLAEKVCRNDSRRLTEDAHSTRRNSSVPSPTSPVRNDSTKPVEVARILKRRNTFVPLSTSLAEKVCRNDSRRLTEDAYSTRRNSSVPSPTSTVHQVCQIDSTKPAEASTLSGILKRRNTFVPSSTLTSGPTKRQVEIIQAPHIMMKRRKSISVIPQTHIHPPKTTNADAKWQSKNVQHKNKRRSLEEKNEIKSKLAALVPKDKVPEVKPFRTNTKIPVKNTHNTRNDQLADTIVKTTTVSCKHKLNSTGLPTDKCKKPRTTEDETANEKLTAIQLRRPSFVHEEVVQSTANLKSNNEISYNRPRFDPVENDMTNEATTAPSTSTAGVKSILKRANSIQKRRATVTFAEESRIKTIATVAPVARTVRCEEDNVDDVIHNIMALGMAALKESSSASINGKNFSYKAVAPEYDSLGHLQNVFIPLMKAELWKEIEDGYAHSKNISATNVQMNYCSRDENHPNRYKCHCESQSPGEIQNGALVLMLSVHSGKQFLGYIINRQITNRICYFQFVTACSIESHTGAPTQLKLTQIMYVRPNLKVFEALFKLKNSPLLQHILHPRQNYTKPSKLQFTYKGYNSLNQDQMITLSTVYRKCIAGHPFISLIEGPPGTGKSRLITNLVIQLLYGKEIKQPLKILVCAPSNGAVDILTKNLMEARKNYAIEKGQKKLKLVRFGVMEKMDLSVRGVSIQGLTTHNKKTVVIEQSKLMECRMKKEAELATYSAKHARDKIIAIRNEIAAIDAKMKNVSYDEKCLLEGANVICTTLNSCCALSSKISKIDICIIDEATQCNEPASLIPLQFGVKSLILVGDTKQLPSTVLSEIAKQYNYDQSLFQRLQKSYESEQKFENPILQLTTQYRMHPDILHWPNQFFYKNRLTSADQVDKFKLKLKPYTVFNLNYVQSLHTGQKHVSNEDEARFVRNLLDFLVTKADPKKFSYGIISAYSQQKNDLAKTLSSTYPYVTVNTIDSCQGQERDIVIISIARTRGIGFLAIRQRLNVALTRAKKILILCGNFNSLQSHPMWTSLLDDARNRQLYIHLPPTLEESSLSSFFQDKLTT